MCIENPIRKFWIRFPCLLDCFRFTMKTIPRLQGTQVARGLSQPQWQPTEPLLHFISLDLLPPSAKNYPCHANAHTLQSSAS